MRYPEEYTPLYTLWLLFAITDLSEERPGLREARLLKGTSISFVDL